MKRIAMGLVIGGLAVFALSRLPIGARVEAQQPNADAAKLADQLDQLVAKKWQVGRVTASPPTTDAEFFRRLYLDVCGVIPPPNEAREFIESRDPNKRRAAIDRLLNTPGYAQNMATIWEARLLGRQLRVQQVNREVMNSWLLKAFTENLPYDQFVRELVTATGTNDQNGAANYTLRFTNQGRLMVEDLTSSATRIFLGTQIQCAQCHDHKTETWKQSDFHGVAAFFARTRPVATRRPSTTDPRPPVEVRDLPFGEQQMELHSGKRETVYPKFFEGLDYKGGEVSRREALAKWMITQPSFGQATANFAWNLLIGRGITDPFDDLRPTNPPTNPELIVALAQDFVAHRHDWKYLLRAVLYSKTYQLSSRTAQEPNPLHAEYFASAPLRQLTPEQLFSSLFTATGLDENQFLRQRGDLSEMKQRLMRFFVITFDTDENEETNGFDGTIPQALMMMNGDLPNRGATAIPGSALGSIINANQGDREKLHAIYLRVLGRFATDAELGRLEAILAKAGGTRRADASSQFQPTGFGGFGKAGPGKGGPLAGRFQPQPRDPRSQVFEDVMWALLNSSEFIFNH